MRPRLERLERRLSPSASIELITTAIAGQPSNSAGGRSRIGNESQGAYDLALGQHQISADGRYTVFVSEAANLVAGQIDNNHMFDIFLYDRVTNSNSLVTHKAGSTLVTAEAGGYSPSISADGRFVAFISGSTDLINGYVPGSQWNGNIFLFDGVSGVTSVVSHVDGNLLQGTNGLCDPPLISADGGWIAFTAHKSVDLVSGYSTTNASSSFEGDIYLHDRTSATNRLISHQAGKSNVGANGATAVSFLSADGRYLAFDSYATNLIAGVAASGKGDGYIYDRVTQDSKLITHVAGNSLAGGSQQATIYGMTDDAHYLLIWGSIENVGGGYSDPANTGAMYRYDRLTGMTAVANVSTNDPLMLANGWTSGPSMSANGSVIIFASKAADLVSGFIDADGTNWDLFGFNAATGAVRLVTHESGMPIQTSNAPSGYSSVNISADGKHILFLSDATNLINGYSTTNALDIYRNDVYRYDWMTDSTSLVSHIPQSNSTGSNNLNWPAILSADGEWIAFSSQANNLTANVADLNNYEDVYVWNSANNGVSLVTASKTLSLTPGGNTNYSTGSRRQQVTDNGRFVIYNSEANNIVANQVDLNGTYDVFLFDRLMNTTRLVSHGYSSTNTTGDGPSGDAVISGDGRYVAFSTYAHNLIPGFVDGNGPAVSGYSGTDVFLWDRITDTTILVSHRFDSLTPGGNQVSGTYFGYIWPLSIGQDGRYLGFRSLAADLVDGFVDANGADSTGLIGADYFLFDRDTGVNVLVNHAVNAPTNGGNGNVAFLSISADGRYLTYRTNASNAISNQVGGGYNVALYDRETNTNTLVSHSRDGINISAGGDVPVISANGQYVLFSSLADNHVPGVTDTNNAKDVFLYDRLTGNITLISHSATDSNQTANNYSEMASISVDGRFVAYYSQAGNLVNGFVDSNGTGPSGGFDIYVFDRVTGLNTLASHSSVGASIGSNDRNTAPSMSGDGRFVIWASYGTNLVTGAFQASFAHGMHDYAYDRLTGSVKLLSHAWTNPLEYANGGSFGGYANLNGSVILFDQSGDNLLLNDYNSWTDLFAYVTPPPRVQSIQINDGSAQRSIIRSIQVTFDDTVFLVNGPWSLVLGQWSGTVSGQCAGGGEQQCTRQYRLDFDIHRSEYGVRIACGWKLHFDGNGEWGFGNRAVGWQRRWRRRG